MQLQSIWKSLKMSHIIPPVLDMSVAKPVIKHGTRNYYTFRQPARPTRLVSRKHIHSTVSAKNTPPPLRKVNRNHLYKTRLCIYAEMCHKQDICPFAHSQEELRDACCLYGTECTKRETCQYKHPDETTLEYRQRISSI